MQKTVDLGDGYAICATRKQVGAFQVVGIDWEHPNYGYFTDAMVWINSPHMGKWQPLSVVGWSRKYKTEKKFLRDYPDFAPLFAIDSIDSDEDSLCCQR